jgi:hypothetical protein
MPPFDTKMAHRHKKGLSPKQARQWAAVARSVYDRCVKDGGSASNCEARAIRAGNSVTGTPAHSTNTRVLSVESALTVQPSRLTLHNREYMTAPAVLLVAGVLNNALVADEELDAKAWDGVPIVIGHPRNADGIPVSARDPDVFAAHGIGTVYRARLGTGKRGNQVVRSLQAELWLDCALVESLGGEAVQALTMLEAQQPVEVSTGFYATAIPQAGTFYGTPYVEMLTGLMPDHLALLPNDIGACSWENGGCGVPRLHQACTAATPCAVCAAAERTPMDPVPATRWQAFMSMLRHFVQQEDGPNPRPPDEEPAPEEDVPQPVPDDDEEDEDEHEASAPDRATVAALQAQQTDMDIREALYSALAREGGMDYSSTFIDSIDSRMLSFVYRQGERLLLRRWSVDSAGILTLDANTQDVQRDTRFLPVPGTEGAAETESDSHPDLPQAMQVHAACPGCGSLLAVDAVYPTLHAACTQCSAPPSPQERNTMTTPVVSPVAIKSRVNNLIANKQYGWSERDRHMLESMDEAFLIRLESQPILMPQPEPEPPPEPPKTAQEAIATLPIHLQDMFTQMHRDYQERRQAALATLMAHKGCPFEQEELQQFTVERLEKLVAMGAGVEYSGKGLPAAKPPPQEPPPPAPNTMERVIERQRAQGLR